MTRLLAALLAAAALAGCANLSPQALPATAGTEVVDCARWYEKLDAAVDRAGVRDAEADRIVGFAGLRVDRIAAALRDRARSDNAVFDAWLARLQRLEDEGRAVEIANLPRTAFAIGEVPDAAFARTQSQRCTLAWHAPLQHDATLRATLLARADVPDRYAGWQRAVGLYPILRGPFLAGVQGWQREQEQAMQRWSAAPPPTQRWLAAGPAPSPAALAALWSSRSADALGLPRFSAEDEATLLAAHAPAFEIETRGDFDRFGAPAWRDGTAPSVDADTPVVYQRVTATRYRDQWLPQLVYSLWFPGRPPQGRIDLLAGRLDAVVVRITLAADDGRPLLVDTIHGCGCYQMFFPTAEVALRENAPTDIEWAFVPARLPAMTVGERVVVRLASATHYVAGIALDEGAAGAPYALRDDRELRTLPAIAGGTRSLFGRDGLVAGSERAERFLYWPMGITSAGAMRQWGHHATAFVGQRHFDDADLIERRFVIPPVK